MKRTVKVTFSLLMAFIYTWVVIGFISYPPFQRDGFGFLVWVSSLVTGASLFSIYSSALLRTGLCGPDYRGPTFLYHLMAGCFAILVWFWVFPNDHQMLLDWWPVIVGVNLLVVVCTFGRYSEKYRKENM